jgi:hypothetical protein
MSEKRRSVELFGFQSMRVQTQLRKPKSTTNTILSYVPLVCTIYATSVGFLIEWLDQAITVCRVPPECTTSTL